MESPQQAGDRLHEALSGKKKEEVVLDVIQNNNLNKRVIISQYYQSVYSNALYDDIKSNIKGDFGHAAALMFLTPLEFCIKLLVKGVKDKDESCIFELLSSKSIEELKLIEQYYQKEIGKSLRDDLDKIFSGVLKTNVLNLFVTQRNTNHNPRRNECESYATTLINAGEKNWVGDENIFREIFLKKSPEELILIARFYLKKTGNNLLDVIDKKISGKNKTLLREVLYNNIMPHEMFAEKINDAIKGLGTNENLLSRVLVSRNELDMHSIRDMYVFKYKETLIDDIVGDTSGMYQKLCVYLGNK